MRLPDGGSETIGSRIIEIPENEEVVLNRDPRLGFIAFVPKGSIAQGKALAEGGGKTIACAVCQGQACRGSVMCRQSGGRQATYVVRQLFMIQNWRRRMLIGGGRSRW